VAATIWQGGGAAGDFNDSANWSNSVPDSTHTPAIFDGSSQADVTLNLGRGADTFRLITTPKYTGNIGSSGSALTWEGTAAAETSANIRGSGAVYLDITGASKDVVVNSKNMTNACTLASATGDIRHLVVLRGHCIALGTCSFTGRAFVYGNHAKLTIYAIASTEAAADYIHVTSGTLINHRIMEDSGDMIIQTGGVIEQYGSLELGVYLYQSGGEFYYEPSIDVSGKTPIAVIADGLFDASESQSAIGFGTLIQGPNATVRGDVTAHIAPTLELWQDYP
jgi:hypothetical protein